MPSFDIEKSLNINGAVFGLDEAGRGPWCGPVVAACVYWPHFKIDPQLERLIDDSKKLTAQKREFIFEQIINSAAVWGIGKATAEEIDKINILEASFLAMKRALADAAQRHQTKADFLLIDGNRLPKNWQTPAKAVIKGDSLSLSIASASVLAKVTRDKELIEAAQQYPGYGWEKNAGYGTKEHIKAIEKLGITPYHRKSYAPIKKFISLQNNERTQTTDKPTDLTLF